MLLTQYYLVSRGLIQIPDCFTASRTGAYHYFHGWNIRAYIAYILGVIPKFYGFLNNMGVHAPIGVTRFYYFAYWVGLFVSGGSFWIMCKVWPPEVIETGWKEPKDYVSPEDEPEVIVAERDSVTGVVVSAVGEKGVSDEV